MSSSKYTVTTHGVLQKQDVIQQWPSLAFFLAAQNRLAACDVSRQIAIRNAVKPIPITIMVQANRSFRQSYINTVCSVDYCFTSLCLGICFSKIAMEANMEFSKRRSKQAMIFAALFFVQKTENYTICARVVQRCSSFFLLDTMMTLLILLFWTW